MIILKNTTKGQNLFLIKSSDSQADEPSSCVLTTLDVEYTSNGEYTVTPPSGYEGLSEVSVTVDVPDNYNEGYADGVVDGAAEQKAKLTSLTATANDTYTREDGYNEVIVNVPSDIHNQDKEVTYTTNGTQIVSADQGYSGLGSVEVTVDVDIVTPYNNGYTAGESAQKAKLSTTTLTSNDTYTREDGWNEVTVNVDTVTPYNNGKADGIAEQKAKLTSTTFTTNDTYTRPDGWNEVTVNVDTVTPYNNGYAAGEAAQKAKLTSLNVTANDTYTRTDGYNEVVVNVQPALQNKTVNPTTSQQTVTADSPNYGLDTVTVNAVTSSIDANIQAGNIKSGVSILGVNGSYDPQPSLQDKTVNPSTSQQVISADNGYDGLDEVTVTAVTSAIDNNITSSNIKNGVTILGITGDYDPQPDLETKSVTYTVNDTYTITPTAGKDGISSVEVTVNVPTGVGCVDWASAGFTCSDLAFINNQMPVIQEAKTMLDNGGTGGGTVRIGNTGYTYNELILLPSGKYSQIFNFTAAIMAGDIVSSNNTARQFFMNSYALNSIRSFALLDGSAPTDTYEMFVGCDALHKAPTVNTSATTNAQSMYKDCRNLSTGFATSFPLATNCSNIFQNCFEITSYPALSFPSATSLYNAFNVSGMTPNKAYNNCEFSTITTSSALTNCASMFQANGLTTCPVFNTENVTDFNRMFAQCTKLTEVPALDYSKGTNFQMFVWACSELTTIPLMDMTSATSIGDMFINCSSLTNVAGFENLGKAFTTAATLNMRQCNRLTKQSVLNIFNYLSAPDAANVYPTIQLHRDVYDQLTSAEIAIATDKRWNVSRV